MGSPKPHLLCSGACLTSWPAGGSSSDLGEARTVRGTARQIGLGGGGGGEGLGHWGGVGGGDQGWGWGADHVDGGCWTQQLHGPRWAQWPIETGRLAVAAPQAAQAPVGCLAVAAVGVAHGTVVQGHWGRSGSTLRRLPFAAHPARPALPPPNSP